MEQIKFSNTHLKSLMKQNKIDDAQKYVQKFFFQSQEKVFFFDGIKFILYAKDQAKTLISSDCEVEAKVANEHTQKFEKIKYSASSFLSQSFFMENNYIPVVDFTTNELTFSKVKKIRGFEYKELFVNMAKPLNIDPSESINTKLLKQAKTDIKMVYSHINEVLCSSNKDVYEYFLNFIACTFGGRKLKTCLYLQSTERTGKGVIINDLLQGILGERMHKTSSTEEILKFTKNFEGTSLINFDELPVANDFKSIQDIMKSLITEPTFISRDMFTKGYTQTNTFNIIISSNNNAVLLSNTNKERYVMLDISECKKGNHKYFKQLTDIISRPEIKQLFYNEMIERFKTLGDWNENIKPMTTTLKVKIIEGLPKIYKYIKEQFILTNIDLDLDTKQFMAEYKMITKDNVSPNQIGRYLKKLEIEPIKQSNNAGYKYKMTSKKLLEVFKANNWMDELIDCIDNEDEEVIEPKQEEISNTYVESKQKIKKNKSVIKVPSVEIPDTDDEEQELSEQQQLKLLEQELDKYF